jgi:putative sigma-54 modulation protein
MEVTPRLREYLDKKISKLDRFLPNVDEIRVDLAVEDTRASADSQIAQLTLWSNGTMLRSEERAGDMFVAIDAAISKMRRQISRYKKRRQDRWQQRPPEAPTPPEPETWEEDEPVFEGEIVRMKRFEVIAMMPAEAIEQMELLGHQFFVFLNAEDGNIAVVYRRRDANYGLILPETS